MATASAIATIGAALVNKFFFVKMPAARSAMPRLAIEFYVVDKVDGRHGWLLVSSCRLPVTATGNNFKLLLIQDVTNVFKNGIYLANAVHGFQSSLLFIKRKYVNGFCKIFGDAFV